MTTPHCPKCEQALSGNNSVISPYTCKCGVWVAKMPFDGEYEISKDFITYHV